MIIRMCAGVPTLAAIIALSIKIMVLPMFNANVEIRSASGVGVSLIALVIANKLKSGNLKIQQRVKI